MKEPSGFSRLSRTFERAVQQLALRFDRERERERDKGRRGRERDCFRKRNTSGTPRAGERRGKNRDANLPSRRWGQLCANAIPFSQVTRKTGHPPRSPYKEWCPVSFFSPPLIFQPPVTLRATRVFVRVRLCTRTRAA